MAISRVLICGSRTFGLGSDEAHNAADVDLFMHAMDRWVAANGLPEVVIEGCAKGADSMAEYWALDEFGRMGGNVTVEHYPAQWQKHGRAAGPIRNQQMLDEGKPEAVIAFSRDIKNSKGTRDMVLRARKHGIPTYIVPAKQAF